LISFVQFEKQRRHFPRVVSGAVRPRGAVAVGGGFVFGTKRPSQKPHHRRPRGKELVWIKRRGPLCDGPLEELRTLQRQKQVKTVQMRQLVADDADERRL